MMTKSGDSFYKLKIKWVQVISFLNTAFFCVRLLTLKLNL